MLQEFLTSHRPALIERCRLKVQARRGRSAAGTELIHGVPLFLDQLIKTLRIEQSSQPLKSRAVSGPSGGGHLGGSEIAGAAASHGLELLGQGFTVDQVVHDYGDLCQAITEMAFEHGEPVEAEEFQTLNRCLDNAIADAVTGYSSARDLILAKKGVDASNERLGILAHELRNLIHTAMMAFAVIKIGKVGLSGATAAVVDRSLLRLRNLVDRSLADVRVTAGLPTRIQFHSVANLIAEVKVIASLEAQACDCALSVSPVDPVLAVDADRDLLMSAIGNLLQNAFKFTNRHSEVSLLAYAAGDRVRIEVKDHCGGLPPNFIDKMFLPFTQGGDDTSGLGLGLSICRRTVEAHHGTLSARDSPGAGCVFTIDLPRHSLPTIVAAASGTVQ